MSRSAKLKRRTKETEVDCRIDLDGEGSVEVATGIGFLDHMLDLFGRHGLFDLAVKAKGDVEVDLHHTVEDVGIVLGGTVSKALGDKSGIRRFGFASVPMGEALVQLTVDVSGRGRSELTGAIPGGVPLSPALIDGFLDAFAKNAGVTLHAEVRSGTDAHHVVEAIFKALGRALREAVETDPREKGVPSTKGVL